MFRNLISLSILTNTYFLLFGEEGEIKLTIRSLVVTLFTYRVEALRSAHKGHLCVLYRSTIRGIIFLNNIN